MIWIMFLLFFLFMINGLPVAFSMGTSATIFILLEGIPISMIAQKFFTNTQSFPFLAVPFFILSGNLMVQSGIASKIIKFANSLIGKLPGSLGCVSVVVSMIMAGVSGSSVADAASTGSILIPEMINQKYTKSFSAAINATTSVVGIIIPPSSTMIVIAWMTNLSVLKMFLAGAIPGIILGLSYLVITVIISIRKKFPREESFSWAGFLESFRECAWVVLFPIVLLLAIILGIATVTEIAAMASLYSLIIGLFIYRSLDFKKIVRAFIDSAKSTTVVMALVCSANIFGWVLIRENIPHTISKAVLSLGLPDPLILFILMLILFAAGMIMDLVANLFIFIPIFFPIILSMGMDPIHFSIILLMSLALGLFTPPVGGTLFISCNIAKIGIEDVWLDLIPYFISGVIVVFSIAYIPQICLWLPDLILR